MAVTDSRNGQQPEFIDSPVNGFTNPLREQGIGQLLKHLATDTSTLVRQEIELAKAEMTEKGKQVGAGAGMLAGAAVVGLLMAGALTATVIAALNLAMPLWVAALIVTVVYAAIAGVLAVVGLKQVRAALPPAPEQTIQTVKEDVAWAKTQMQSAGK